MANYTTITWLTEILTEILNAIEIAWKRESTPENMIGNIYTWENC